MNQIIETVSVDNDRLDFLDLLAIAAESWKLIVIGTLLVAIATAVVLLQTPPVYESFASVPLSPRLRAALNSSNLLDQVINANNLANGFDGDMEAARDALWRKIKIEELARETGFYRIGVQGDTPAQAKALVLSYLTQILLQSRPTSSEVQLIQQKIALAQYNIVELQKLSEYLLPGSISESAGVKGPGKSEDNRYPTLFTIPIEIARNKGDILALQHSLNGLRMEDILEQPTLPMRPFGRKRLSRFLTSTSAGFVALIFFAYVRDATRKLNNDPERARKVRRILDAFWRRQNKVGSA